MPDNFPHVTELDKFYSEAISLVNRELDRLIPEHGPAPQTLRDAIRWSLFAGGKRFRPALVIASGRGFGAADERIVGTAAAIEMIHTYSLIHDDLPSMDDDDLRRGRETCHKKFGEATAILAGDALQALAFETIAVDTTIDEPTRIELICGLGRAAAYMVVGQHLDLESEGKPLSITDIERIHTNKTGALIAFSVNAGAVIAGANTDERDAIERFGRSIGLLFQVVDDVLDVTGTTEALGKTAGKDENVEKATYPKVLGLDETGKVIDALIAEAESALDEVGREIPILRNMVAAVAERTF